MNTTPVGSQTFNVAFAVTLSAVPTGTATAATAVVQNLQCVTLMNQVVFSNTFNVAVSFPTASGIVTDSFAVPYANGFSIPGTVAGMFCDLKATLNSGTFTTATRTFTLNFTITASTDFPPPPAVDVDSNIGVVGSPQ